jgi:arabinogalactan oligomer/maltooligosaccharide transport system permease protein
VSGPGGGAEERAAAARRGRVLAIVGGVVLLALLLYRPVLSLLAPPTPGLVVRLWHSQRGREREVLEAQLRAFNVEHRGRIQVEPLGVPEASLKDKLLRNVPRGSGPDLFIASHNELGEYERGGVLHGGDASAALSSSRERYFPALLEAVTVGGRVRGVPLTFKGLVQFYNVDLGGPIRDTAELGAARAALPADAVPLAYDATSLFFHSPLLLGAGGEVLDAQGEPAIFDGAGGATFRWPGEWKRKGWIPAEPGYNEAVRLFEEGKARAIVNGPWYEPKGPIAESGRWGVAPLFDVEGRPAGSFITVEAVFIAASTRAPGAAHAVARWIGDGQDHRFQELGQPSVLDADPGKEAVRPAPPDDAERRRHAMREAQTRALTRGRVTPSTPRMAAVWNPALDVLSASVAGRDVDAAEENARWELSRSRPTAESAADPRPFGVVLTALLLAGCALIAVRVRRGLGDAAVRRAALVGRGGRRALPFLVPGLLAVVSLVMVPLVVGAGMSLYAYEGGQFTFVGLRNFAGILLPPLSRAFEARSFYFALGVTVLWTVTNVVLSVALGVAIALLLRPTWNRLRTPYRIILILPWAIPNYITALLWKGMFNAQVGAINALLGMEGFSWFDRFSTAFTANLVTNVWLGFPFMMVTTLGALSQVPAELEEAATLDGAGRWLRFRYVVWPHVAPALVPAVVLSCIWTFNMFNVVYLVSGGEPGSQTDILISEAYRWAFERGQRYGYAAAYSVLIFFFLLFFSRVSERATARAAPT